MNDWLLRYSYAIRRPQEMCVIKGITGSEDTARILAELREKDPDGYANLMEFLLLDEENI